MDNPREETDQRLQELAAEIWQLEQRVRGLERAIGLSPAPRTLPEPSVVHAHVGAAAMPPLNAAVVPVLGRAMLGLAGAYLLRAVAESGAVPHGIAVVAGLMYAGVWLVSSTRVRAGDVFGAATYALTAAIVLSPMLWETTVRFHVLPPAAAAAVLVLFVAAGTVLAWPRNLAIVTWISTLAGVSTALVLLFATRALAPFAAALLVMAIVVEYAACCDHFLGERWIVAFAANFSVLTLARIAARPQGVPEGYESIPVAVALAIQMGLLTIYLGSTVYRTLVHRLEIAGFEIGQLVVAFLISMSGALAVTRGAAGTELALGAFCLASGAACYVIAFAVTAHESRRRNFHAYATFGLVLLLAGSWISLSAPVAVFIWCALAIAAASVSRRTGSLTMAAHMSVFLVAAAAASGLLAFMREVVISRAAASFPPAVETLTAAFASALCFATVGSARDRKARLAGTAVAAVLCGSVLALSASFFRVAIARDAAGPFTVAAVNAAVLCAMSLILPSAASRMRRPELLWLLWPLAAIALYNLVTNDLAQGSPASLAISLLLYGGTLIVLPRRVRAASSRAGAAAAAAGGTEPAPSVHL